MLNILGIVTIFVYNVQQIILFVKATDMYVQCVYIDQQ